ncbi:protein SAMBA isoform X2 [Oryza brachyantha]|uniref:protein SAMBA isoform X2 n=1 Tax=Oryza brachyantha TaxID=4533 RepID=UPI001ADC5F6F|nr:protein SAMBA isoform X2 [Oryza brachyantha]
MSSPARSTVSAASAGAISAADDVADSIDALYRKDEAMAELKSEVMEALQKEVRSLDDDSWMFAAPRSRINLVSMSEFFVVAYARSKKNWLTSVKRPRRQGTSRY